MYNLNGNNLYGHVDGRLGATVGGNFEFRFSARENISRAIKKYKEQRAAELASGRKEQSSGKPNMPRFCKVRHSGRDVTSMVTSRDCDVETHLSRQHNGQAEGNTLARLSGGSERHRARQRHQQQPKQLAAKRSVQQADLPPYERIEALHREVCAELEQMSQSQMQAERPRSKAHGPLAALTALTPRKRKLAKRRVVAAATATATASAINNGTVTPSNNGATRPGIVAAVHEPVHIKVDEVLERLKGGARVAKLPPRKPDVAAADGGGPTQSHVCYEHYPQPLAKWVEVMHSAVMSQAIKVSVCEALNSSPMDADHFMEQHGSVEPEPLSPFFLEDSDLEHEYAERARYLRYCEPRPQPRHRASESERDEQPVQENACFVELERRPHRLSLLRSVRPMRYSSQRSEETVRKLLAARAAETAHVPVVAGRSEQQQARTASKSPRGSANAGKASRSHNRASKMSKTPTSLARGNSAKGRPANKASVRRTPASPPMAFKASGDAPGAQLPRQQSVREKEPTATATPTPTPSPPPPPPPRKRKARAVLCTKSLEDLKYEKLNIYNKMALTQERIIGSLDRLQNSLLQLEVPECNSYEKSRRERNAFEFCVRFSRNFLYPLKGMIDDVRYTPESAFSSATSNEACQRVVSVYGLMQQSIMTYQRQLRYFLLDKVPQKLSALIEMIYTMTNVCLDKGMFDRQDPIMECLLQRCTKFLTFIEDMQEERFQLARETYRRLHTEKRAGRQRASHHHQIAHHPHTHTHTHSHNHSHSHNHNQYDLKMCLNDLKLYEPRLVPKERERNKNRVRLRTCRPRTSPGELEQTSNMQLLPPDTDRHVQTHIECVQVRCQGEPSSKLSLHSRQRALPGSLSLLPAPLSRPRSCSPQHGEMAPLPSLPPSPSPTPTPTPTPSLSPSPSPSLTLTRGRSCSDRNINSSSTTIGEGGEYSVSKQDINRFVAHLNLPSGQAQALNEALLQALQQATQSQVLKVLEPIVRSLNGMLDQEKCSTVIVNEFSPPNPDSSC